jgi:hypothetical protein
MTNPTPDEISRVHTWDAEQRLQRAHAEEVRRRQLHEVRSARVYELMSNVLVGRTISAVEVNNGEWDVESTAASVEVSVLKLTLDNGIVVELEVDGYDVPRIDVSWGAMDAGA